MAKLYAYNTSATPVKKRYAMIGSTATQVKKKYAMIGSTATLVYSAWNGELLDGADECTDVTGGWNGNGYTGETWMTVLTQDGSGLYYAASSGMSWGRTGTVNKVDLSNYTKIVAEVEFPNGIYTLSAHFGIMSDKTKAILSNMIISDVDSSYTNLYETSRTYELNVTNYNDSYYIAFAGVTGTGYPFRITKITMS